MKIAKSRSLISPRLPGLTEIPSMAPQAGTTRHPGKSNGGAGRLGRALRDARSAESTEPPPKTPSATARAVAGWENEGGRAAKGTVVAGSTKKKLATKPVKSPSTQRVKKPLDAEAVSAPAARGTKTAPRASPLLGQGRAKHRTAESRVKSSQVKRAGLESRVLGHVSASGKRSQARRDSKN